MPAIEVRSTTLTIVRHFGVPSAYAASRSSLGTILSISSVERTTTGIISTDSATAPMKPSRTDGPSEQREQREREEARDDRRDAGHDVDEERDRPRQPAAAVLHQVDGGEQADRDRDHRGQRRDDQRAHDGVVAPAALADDAAHGLGEERRVEAGQAVLDHDHDHRDQRDQRQQERDRDQDRHEPVGGLAPALDTARDRVGGDGVDDRRRRPATGRSLNPVAASSAPTTTSAAPRIAQGAQRGSSPRLASDGGRAASARRPCPVSMRHQFAPENSRRRLTIHRAAALTSSVITNRTRPDAMSTFTARPVESGNCSAMLPAIVDGLSELIRLNVTTPRGGQDDRDGHRLAERAARARASRR